LSAALGRAIQSSAEFARSRSVRIIPLPPDEKLVIADRDLLARALRALLETAIRFSEKGNSVELSLQLAPDSCKVIIESHGLEIPSQALAKFFEIFAIGEAITVDGGDLGLAAPLAYRILSLFGGSVSVSNRDQPPGIRLTVSLKDGTAHSQNK
jgi:K+-sensing histidine kinase KdpD